MKYVFIKPQLIKRDCILQIDKIQFNTIQSRNMYLLGTWTYMQSHWESDVRQYICLMCVFSFMKSWLHKSMTHGRLHKISSHQDAWNIPGVGAPSWIPRILSYLFENSGSSAYLGWYFIALIRGITGKILLWRFVWSLWRIHYMFRRNMQKHAKTRMSFRGWAFQ